MLNEKQQQVVADLEHNILLNASAGTGKTSTISYRVKHIIQTGVARPDEILCLTFTNRACKELEKKIVPLVKDDEQAVVIRTVHSFCYDVLQTEAKNSLEISMDFLIFDEDDCKEIINTLNVYDHNITLLQRFINEVKHYRAAYDIYSTSDATDYAQTIARMFLEDVRCMQDIFVYEAYNHGKLLREYLLEEGNQLVSNYNHHLQQMNALDFNDLIIKVYELFKDRATEKFWREKFKYLIIDEMQDTSLFEYRIIAGLFLGNNVMLCGDYFQTIYEWRGSRPDEILQVFKKDWLPEVISFDENYRATKTLLNASYACLQKLFGDKVDTIYTMPVKAMNSEAGAKIALQSSPGLEAEARWIYEKIQELKVTDVSKIGILTRSNKYNRDLSECFVRLNQEVGSKQLIEFMLVGQFKFFRRKEIKDVVACLKFLVNKYDVNSLQRIIKYFAGGVGSKTLEVIKSPAYRKAGISLVDFVELRTHADGDPFKRLLDAKNRNNIIVFDVETTGLDMSMDEIVQIAAIRLDAQGRVIETFERFLQPGKSVGASEKVHGFSDEFLKKNGELSTVVLQDCLRFSENATIIGHNVYYDICIFKSQSKRLGIDTINFGKDVYDTLDLFRRFYPDLISYKLSFLSEYFQIKEKPTHNALNDVIATAELLAHVCKKNIEPLTEQRRIYVKKYIGQFKQVTLAMQKLVEEYRRLRPYELIGEVVNKLHIKAYYEKRKQEARIQRLREFYLLAKEIDDVGASNHTALIDLLKVTALSNSELDRIVAKWPRIPIITVHQAKGAEFEYEFFAGLAEGIFPTWQALQKDNLEEEKRLFYVAITRAKQRLYLSWSNHYNGKKLSKSRFLDAIPVEFMMEGKISE